MINQSLRTDDCAEEVIDNYKNMVYRLAYSQTKTQSTADDIFQEVFLRYIRKKQIFKNEEHRKAWLIRVTINCCKKMWSSAWYRKTVPLEDSLTFDTPEENFLHDILKQLPKKYRIVIHLFYYENISIDEMSDILKIKPSTIRTQLTRARAMLKDKLKGEF